MPYATDRLYFDADSHIMETKDWIANFADPEVVRKLPEMSLLKSGTKSFDHHQRCRAAAKSPRRPWGAGSRRREGIERMECARRIRLHGKVRGS